MGTHDCGDDALIALRSTIPVVLCGMTWRVGPEVIIPVKLLGGRILPTFPPGSRRLLDKEIVDRQSSTIHQYQGIDEQTGQLLRTGKSKVQQIGDDEHQIVCQERPQLTASHLPTGMQQAVEEVAGGAQEEAAQQC